jgi:hypothetical protein
MMRVTKLDSECYEFEGGYTACFFLSSQLKSCRHDNKIVAKSGKILKPWK